jgi:endonuclease/exonuclease/phosphatase family metal-dependent hydrolase
MRFWIRILCFAGLLLALPAFAPAQTPKGAMRVMTFNIRFDNPADGLNAWVNRKQKVADVIRFHKADIVGVQEALVTQLRDLENLLPDFAWCGVGRSDGKEGGEFSAILYRKSRFQMIDNRTFWLSETPDVPGSKSWDAAITRIVTWAKLKDRSTGKKFFAINTHFDHVGQRARVESALLILKKIEGIAKKTPFVLTGDFNIQRDNEAYRTIAAGTAAVRLADARTVSKNGHFGGDSTWNAFKELEPGRTIDYIFVREGVKVFEHGVLSDRWNGLWASDHLPVIAEIAFP